MQFPENTIPETVEITLLYKIALESVFSIDKKHQVLMFCTLSAAKTNLPQNKRRTIAAKRKIKMAAKDPSSPRLRRDKTDPRL